MATEVQPINLDNMPDYLKEAIQDWADGIKGRREFDRVTGDELSGYEKSDTGTLWQLFDDNLILLDKKVRLVQEKFPLPLGLDAMFEDIFSNLYSLAYELKYRVETVAVRQELDAETAAFRQELEKMEQYKNQDGRYPLCGMRYFRVNVLKLPWEIK